LSLAASENRMFPVTEILSNQTSVALGTLNRSQLELFSGKETPAQIRAKLEDLVSTQEALGVLQIDTRTTQAMIDEVFRDQVRLRENLKALQDSREDRELRTRYLEQLNRQEDDIKVLRSKIESLNKDISAAQSKISDLITNLTWAE
jgi:DNA repair exonuclease SbcCD ATPase subunit